MESGKSFVSQVMKSLSPTPFGANLLFPWLAPHLQNFAPFLQFFFAFFQLFTLFPARI